jgi:hypothetical protein
MMRAPGVSRAVVAMGGRVTTPGFLGLRGRAADVPVRGRRDAAGPVPVLAGLAPGQPARVRPVARAAAQAAELGWSMTRRSSGTGDAWTDSKASISTRDMV